MDIEIYNQKTFEDIKHITEDGVEYWLARELQEILGYKEWRNFLKVIEKAKNSTETTDIEISDHFVDVNKMVEIGIGSHILPKGSIYETEADLFALEFLGPDFYIENIEKSGIKEKRFRNLENIIREFY